MKRILLAGVTLAVLLLCISPLGCKGAAEAIKALPPGTQVQTTTTGLAIAPQSLDGTPFKMGVSTLSLTTAQPDNTPNLNRFEAKGPFLKIKSTIATGAVGRELKEAGGPEALRFLLGSEPAADARFPESLNDPTKSQPAAITPPAGFPDLLTAPKP